VTFLRSAIFLLWFALVSATLAIVFLPALALPRAVTVWMSRRWSALVFWGLRVITGIAFEVRGTRPANGVLVAAKHMSMWDTLALYIVLDDPAIVLKRELLYIPFYGWFLWKATAIAIDRGAGLDTVIGAGSMIDNLVQIGHNVQMGRGCVLCGQAGIAGSTRLGDYVFIAAQGGLAGHLSIGSAARIGAQAGVMRDVPPGETVIGAPAVPQKDYRRSC